jgi:hypothetical protein
MTEMTKHTRATIVATLVLTGGVAASLAGNIVAIHLDNQRPGVGAIVSATVWPLVLFGVVELLLHTPWVANWRDHLTKLATVTLVASVAAWISYWHLANVLSHYGYDVASRYAGPLAVDSAMVLAALALNRVGQARRSVAIGHNPDGSTFTVQNKDGSPVTDMPRLVFTAQDEVSAEELDRIRSAFKDMATGTDRAVQDAGQELAAEAEGWLAGLQSRVQTEHTLPVPVSPGPMRERKPRTEIDAQEAQELAWRGRVGGHYRAGEIAELLAGWYGVSARTIRRQAWWSEAMGRDASEAADAS